jgi:hypothetical protein
MFVSNESSSQLGLSVAAAMTIHNFIEGFLIALPLYYATESRLSAFGYASILGGMSQPLGAVLGLLAIRNVDDSQSNLLFGVIFGVVSGMMCLIAVQVKRNRYKQKKKGASTYPLHHFLEHVATSNESRHISTIGSFIFLYWYILGGISFIASIHLKERNVAIPAHASYIRHAASSLTQRYCHSHI